MKNRFYPLKWVRATEAARDLRCGVEIKGTTTRWNCLLSSYVQGWGDSTRCVGRGWDGGTTACPCKMWCECGVENVLGQERAHARGYVCRGLRGCIFLEPALMVSSLLYFNSTKINSPGSIKAQTLLSRPSKMKDDFSFHFIKCRILMPRYITFPQGKLIIRR